MKTLRFLFVAAAAMLATTVAMAQSGFNYQAVIRNSQGDLVANQNISLRISLMNGDNTLYQEQQAATTNTFGVVSVVVGSGTPLTGSFSNIDWSKGNISMKTEFDPNGNDNFAVIGTTQLQAVPMAEYAKTTSAVENPSKIQITADNAAGDDEELFSVKDNEGNVVFAVYKSGVRVYVDDTDNGGKAAKSGFAVTGRKAKDGEANTYFAVDNYGTQVYVDDEGSDKAAKAKFAVTSVKKGKDGETAEVENYLVVNKQGTQVYVDGDEGSDKAAKAKFAVTSVKKGKATTEDNVFVINEEGTNVFVDDQSDGKAAKAKFAVTSVKKGKDGESLADNYLVVNDEGTKVYVDGEDSKAAKAKFAVTSVRSGKAEEADDFFLINKDGTKVFIDEEAQGKAAKAKFAVTSVKKGKDGENAGNSDYMLIDSDSTRIYIDEAGNAKAAKSGFAVTGKSANKAGNKNLFNIDLATEAKTINGENRIYWYPAEEKNAFMAGNLKVDNASDVGTNSFNAGYQNKASGDFSQAFGYKSEATGQTAMAIGNQAKASGKSSFSFGEQTTALGESSVAIGRKANSALKNAYALGDSAQAKGTGSYAIGEGAEASGKNAYALGKGAKATGISSYAFGANALASGQSSFALGGNVEFDLGEILGDESFIGYTFSLPAPEATGIYSLAVGMGNKAIGMGSSAFGSITEANGNYSTTFGSSTKASGENAIAMGYETKARGNNSFATGNNSSADGKNSMAMGYECSAEGENSIAMGYRSWAKKNTSIAIGTRSGSSQSNSIALGYECQNIGNNSIAIGNGIKTSALCVAIGQYNSTTDADFVIGNGNSDDNRHDAMIIDNARMKINCMEVIPIFQGSVSGPNLGTSDYPWLEVHAKKIYLNDSRILTNDNNVIIGKQTGWNNTSGANDIFIGYRAGYSNTQSKSNIFIGYESGLNYNDKSSDGNGRGGNVFVGDYTGTAKDGASGTTTGRRNSFFGYYAGWSFEEGSNNIFIGAGAGENFTKGSGNIFIGNEAGMNATGSNKLYIDNSRTATPLIYGEFDNSLLKVNGKLESTTQIVVTANKVSDGSGILVNKTAPDNFTTEYIGVSVGLTGTTNTGNLQAIHGQAHGKGTSCGVWGKASYGTTRYGVYGEAAAQSNSWAVYAAGNLGYTGNLAKDSDVRLKKEINTINGALDKVLRLRGVTYYWKNREEMAAAKGENPDSLVYGYGDNLQIGVIAQELEEVLPELVSTDNDGFKSVDYVGIAPVLIEAVKELKAEKDALEAKVEKLEKMVEELMKNK